MAVLLLIGTGGLFEPDVDGAQWVSCHGGAMGDRRAVAVGSHVEIPLRATDVIFRACIDGGFGRGLVTALVDTDVLLRNGLEWSDWRLYQGFGATVGLVRFGRPRAGRGVRQDRRGLHVPIVGVAHMSDFFTEFKSCQQWGSGAPLVRFAAGFTTRPGTS